MPPLTHITLYSIASRDTFTIYANVCLHRYIPTNQHNYETSYIYITYSIPHATFTQVNNKTETRSSYSIQETIIRLQLYSYNRIRWCSIIYTRRDTHRFIVWIPKSNNLQNLKALLNMVELSGERDISAYAKL